MERVLELQKELTDIKINHWINEELFSPLWWLQLVLFILPWVIWWKLADKKRITDILAFGLLVLIVSTLFDRMGNELLFWAYPVKLIPLFPSLLSFDFAGLPVAYMLIYQYCPKWTQFIIANILASAAYSFVVEPAIIKLGFYQIYKWKFIYSFPIYILIAASLKGLLEYIKSRK